MRTETAMVAVMALAVAGCSGMGKKLGFTDESDKDWSRENSAGNTFLDLDAPQKVFVEKFETDFKATPPKVKVVLRNDGDTYDIFSVDVEFGYPAPPESFAEYEPQFVSVDIADFQKGQKTKEIPVSPPQGVKGIPLFARFQVSKGGEVRMTTAREGKKQGTLLLGGRVEVVGLEGNLEAAEKREIAFTLENVDAESPTKPVGDLRYIVQFTREGKLLDLGRLMSRPRPVGEPLGPKGSRVVVKVQIPETATAALAGAKPVLRLIQQQ